MNKNSLKLEFQSSPERDYVITYLENRENVANYEVEMINNNRAVRALTVEIKQLNEKIKVIYDITGKMSIKKYLKGRTLKKSEFISILKNMTTCLVECKNYFLDERKYFMKLDAIFIDEKDLNMYFIYLPFNIDDKEDINNTYRNIVKNLICDYVKFQEKDSENIIEKTLNYLRKENFTIYDFKGYLEKFEQQNLEIIYDTGNSQEERSQFTKNIRENTNVYNNDVYEKVNTKAFIIYTQLIIFGIVGIIYIFVTNYTIMIIVIAIVIFIDLILTIFVLNKKFAGNKVETVSGKLGMSIINKDIEENSKVSKREIITEMSFDTELLDKKIAFLMLKKAGTVEKIFITKDIFKIGRLHGAVDYVSDNRAVGKVHAEITRNDDKYYLIDLNSKNGTYVNGQKISSNKLYEIKNQDRVVFANSEFIFGLN